MSILSLHQRFRLLNQRQIKKPSTLGSGGLGVIESFFHALSILIAHYLPEVFSQTVTRQDRVLK
jgi:hypothetical protein